MNIGIDIDGVLTDVGKFQIDYASKYAYENNLGKIVNPYSYDTDKIFDWSKEEDYRFWEKYLPDYAKNEKARVFADEVTKKLSDDGNKIYIITSRSLSNLDTDMGKLMRNTVINWLKDNNIYYDEIIFTDEDKRRVCIDYNIDIMIEDAPKNIMELSKVLPNVICFDAVYNKGCTSDNITRCYSWYDIYTSIKDIISKKD